MKTPPPRYRELPRPVRRRPRWGLILACLPLSGLLLGLLVCALIGGSTALVWLAAPAESNSVARVRRLQPLPLPTLTPTLLPTTVIASSPGEVDPVDPALPALGATSGPTPLATITPTLTLDSNPAPAGTTAQVGSEVTQLPADAATPIPPPDFTPPPNVDERVAPTDTPAAVPIPESWKDYMNRSPKSED
jgi:hypothetical protein